MIFIPDEKMNINKFVDTQLPTKSQIFSRTGQHAVNPAGMYTGDNPYKPSMKPTEQAEAFVKEAEAFELPKEDLPE